jgi:hypothetical protein
MFLRILALLPDRRPRASNGRHFIQQWLCPRWLRATQGCPPRPDSRLVCRHAVRARTDFAAALLAAARRGAGIPLAF